MKEIIFILRQIGKGKSVTRTYLNLRLSKEVIYGKTLDVGGGWNSDYVSFMKKSENAEILTFDIKNGEIIDFEKDRLPAEDGAYDTVLFLNVMEHIFNYQHIANEVFRVTKKNGKLIGFVPFLMWYHADHRDFFRYTHEALENIFHTAGVKNISIEVIGAGPFIAASHMVISSCPRVLRIPIFLSFYLFDKAYLLFRKNKSFSPYALGYYFYTENI